MNTQIMHCHLKTSSNNARVYDIEEGLSMQDIETIAKNGYPIPIIFPNQNSQNSFSVELPLDISENDGVLTIISTFGGDSLQIATGEYIMTTIPKLGGLNPYALYLLRQSIT